MWHLAVNRPRRDMRAIQIHFRCAALRPIEIIRNIADAWVISVCCTAHGSRIGPRQKLGTERSEHQQPTVQYYSTANIPWGCAEPPSACHQEPLQVLSLSSQLDAIRSLRNNCLSKCNLQSAKMLARQRIGIMCHERSQQLK